MLVVGVELRRCSVTSGPVDLDDELMVGPVGIYQPALDVDVDLRDRQALRLAEREQQSLVPASGMRKLRETRGSSGCR